MIKRQRISNYKIKQIIHYFCLDIDATKTSVLSGFNRNTINTYFSFFRDAIYYHQCQIFNKLVGTIEVDESYFGSGRKRGSHGNYKRGRGTNKQPVFGIIQRQDENGKKYVFTQIVNDCKRDTLLPIILSRVDLKATINADSWKSYDGLIAVGYDKLFRVNHGKDEFAFKGDIGDLVSINGIESFWSFTKRRLAKFNGYMTKLDQHLKECEWRWIYSPPNKNQSKKEQQRYLLDLESDMWKIYKSYVRFIKRRNKFNKLTLK